MFLDRTDSFEKYKYYTKYVSPARREKISRFAYDKDRLLSLFAALLVRQELGRFTGMQNHELSFSVNNYGKPYLTSARSVCEFSVSHTKGCIAYIRSDSPCGIDAEVLHDVKISLAEHFFCTDEYVYIKSSESPEAELINIWTKKEAYLKMRGTGLSTPLSSFNVLSRDIAENTVTLFERSTYISFCSENVKDSCAEISEIGVNELLTYFDSIQQDKEL